MVKMSASITCPQKGGNLIDMECCRNCFYKRLDSDYSLRWCRYNRYQTLKRNIQNRIKKAVIELRKLESKQERLYKTGKVGLAHSLEADMAKVKKIKEVKMIINDAIAKITEEALKINNPAVTAVEEFLTDHCKTEEYAKALLNPKKNLKGCWDEITKKAREKAANNTAVLSAEEVFNIAEKYFDITETPHISYASKVVNILDVL